MIKKLLLVREEISRLYGRYSMVFKPLSRFLMTLGALLVMGQYVGFGSFDSLPVFLAVSLLGAWLPTGINILMVALLTLLNLYSLSLEVMATVAALMVMMFCVNYVVRPEMNWLILVLPICHFLGIPYAPVLIVGLTGSLLEAVPVVFATILYSAVSYIGNNTGVFSAAGSLQAVEKYMQLISGLMSNREMWLMCASLCAMLVFTWFVGRLKVDYARQIGMGSGITAGLLVMLIGIFALDLRISMVALILGLVASALIAYMVDFMMLPLNFLQTEYVQFEDDDYYYYVKAVPKMAISRPDVQVKKLNIRKELENTSAIPDVSDMEMTDELPDMEGR